MKTGKQSGMIIGKSTTHSLTEVTGNLLDPEGNVGIGPSRRGPVVLWQSAHRHESRLVDTQPAEGGNGWEGEDPESDVGSAALGHVLRVEKEAAVNAGKADSELLLFSSSSPELSFDSGVLAGVIGMDNRKTDPTHMTMEVGTKKLDNALARTVK